MIHKSVWGNKSNLSKELAEERLKTHMAEIQHEMFNQTKLKDDLMVK